MKLEGRELNEISLAAQLQGTGCSIVLLPFSSTQAELFLFNDKAFLIAGTLFNNLTNIFFPPVELGNLNFQILRYSMSSCTLH